MLKSIKKLMAQEKEKYRIPRKVQDLIPIDCIWKDGIFRSGNKYSKVYRFTDINYQVASQDDKKLMFFDYSAHHPSWASAQILQSPTGSLGEYSW